MEGEKLSYAFWQFGITNEVYTLGKTKQNQHYLVLNINFEMLSPSIFNGIEIKQHAKVNYLGCILDESLSGESMALNVISKINSHLKFLHRQNSFLTPPFA